MALYGQGDTPIFNKREYWISRGLTRAGLVAVLATVCLLLLPPPDRAMASADVTCTGGFKLHFDDVANANGIGFADPVQGAARRNTACGVFTYLATNILQMGGAQPDVEVLVSQLDGTGPIATGGQYYPDGSTPGFSGGTLWTHITTGTDPTPAPGSYDAHIQVDFGPRTVGTSTTQIFAGWPASAGGQIDLFSVMLHESMHALGFASGISATGTSTLGAAYTRFDRYLQTAGGNPLLTASAAPTGNMSGAPVSNTLRYFKTGNSAPQAVFSPVAYQMGSSLSHFDAFRDNVQYLMRSSTMGGQDRTITSPEIDVLCNIGYTLQGTVCSDHYPVGTADTGTTTPGGQVCITVIANDTDADGDPIWIDPASVVMFTGGGGYILLPAYHPTQLCYTPSAYFAGTAVLTYQPTDGQRDGNPTKVNIAVLAQVCPNDPTNLICNGGFETGVPATTPLDYVSLACGGSRVDDWCDSMPSSDLYIRGGVSAISASFGIPSNFMSPTINTWDFPATGNNRFVGMARDGVNNYREGIKQQLLHPLTNGQQYKLDFYATGLRIFNFGQHPYDGNMMAFLDNTGTGNGIPSGSAQVFSPLSVSINTTPTGWTHVVQTFTAAGASLNWIVIQGAANTPSGSGSYFFVDNARLKPVNGGPDPHLTISKTVDNANPKLGQIVNFSITVCNTSSTALTNVVINDNLPAGLTYVSGMSAYPQHTISYLAASACVTITLRAQVATTAPVNTTITNCAGVVGSSPVVYSCTDIKVPATDIAVTKALFASPSGMGGTAIFTITVSNLGPIAANGIVVHDALPTGANYASNTITGGTATFNSFTRDLTIPHLPAQASVVLTLNATLAMNLCGQGTLTNTASLTAITETDLNTENNNSSATVALPACPSGTLKVIKIVVNTTGGPVPQIPASFPMHYDCSPYGPTQQAISVTPGAAGTSVSVQANSQCQVREDHLNPISHVEGCHGGSASWTTAIVPLTPVTVALNTTVIVTVTNTLSCDGPPGPHGAKYDVGIRKSANSPWPLGSAGVFHLAVTNNGAALNPPVGISVDDSLPPGMRFVAAAGNGWSCQASAPVACTYAGAVAAGEVLPSIVVTAIAGKEGRTQGCATVTLNGAADGVAANNRDCVDVTVGKAAPGSDNTVTSHGGAGKGGTDIGIANVAPSASVPEGGTAVFELTVSNFGAPLKKGASIELTDKLPDGLMLVAVAGAPCSRSANTLSCDFTGNIPSGVLRTIRVTARSTRAGRFDNCASVSLIGKIDTVPDNNSSCATVYSGMDKSGSPTTPPPLIVPPHVPKQDEHPKDP
jgi:uncharacterized repeat protein (TIGR01451 family)